MLGILIISNCIISVLCLSQQCFQGQPCPVNSVCSTQNDYCVCNPGFIGACNISATLINNNPINIVLTDDQTLLFYIVPSTLNEYIMFQFNLCQNNNQLDLVFSLWGETGTNINYTSSNTISGPTTISIGNGCQTLYTPYISFGSQPNGQNQLLIFGIQNTDNTVNATLSVTQTVNNTFSFYFYVLIAAVAVLIVSSAIAAAFCIYRRRMRRRRGLGMAGAVPSQVVNIDHFDNYMPLFKAQLLGSDKSVCPICLSMVQNQQFVRKTPCGHVFHSQCLDSWCLKNMSCPVCRQELDEASIKNMNSPRVNEMVGLPPPPLPTNNNNMNQRQSWQEQQLGVIPSLEDSGVRHAML